MPTSLPNIPLPPGETQRLAALRSYRILDTLPEQAYDDLTLLAARLCDAPIALITLIDAERQWFKSRVHFDPAQTPRYLSFCAHAILTPADLMLVPDALADPRFADNILVTQAPFIRFYAGAPLVTTEGHALGTLCVIDRVPRIMPSSQLDALRALARQVVSQLELRRSNAWIQRYNELLTQSHRESEQYEARLREITAQLHWQSFTDALTGIYNRRAFDLHLAKAVADAAGGREPVSLVLLDVDHFKSFNDEFGHAAGDEVLQRVAACIRNGARKHDIAARYGGEEFAVILPQTDAGHAFAMGQRLCDAVGRTPWKNRAITVSAGVATRYGTLQADVLVGAADRALYRAKAEGRNRVSPSSVAKATSAG